MARLIDVSHQIVAGMTTYPGLPAPVVEDHLSFEESREDYASGTEFQIRRISMVGNTGTYLDTPSHRYRDGWSTPSAAGSAPRPSATWTWQGGPC
jgi:arylformamidase